MTPQLEARARLYALRILNIWAGRRIPWDSITQLCNIQRLIPVEEQGCSVGESVMRPLLETALAAAEQDPMGQGPPDPSVVEFAEAMDFTETETKLLELMLLINYSPAFEPLAAADRHLSLSDVAIAAATAVGVTTSVAHQVICTTFVEAGLREDNHAFTDDLQDQLELAVDLSPLVADHRADLAAILSRITREVPASGLVADDFDYLQADVATVANILLRATQERTAGVSILLYGAPGLGKSEFARVVVREALATPYEPGESIGKEARVFGSSRIGGLRASQRVLSRHRRAVLIVDEAEDILADTSSWRTKLSGASPRISKMQMTSILEQAPVPTIWIANEVDWADPALLRRFTYAVRFDAPPREARRRMLAEQFTSLPVSPEWLDARAAERQLPQAVTALAARAVRMSGSVVEAEAVADRALSSVRDLLNLPEPANDAVGPAVYDLEFLNTGLDLRALIETIGQSGEGRICLYGPPGTGKSAFALHLARRLGREVLRKSAADLLSCWLGETEKNISRMFREGRRYNDVILLDEADSFLRDRQHAHRSWEVSQVNELLMQMENYSGIFICTTNLKETLDAASLRRFDLKIHCDWLRPEQATQLAERHLVALGQDWPSDAHAKDALKARLRRITNLTPGDFAAVLRGQRLLGDLKDASQLVALLEEECAAKPDAPKAQGVGFV
jgi:transitional endoplasmic reticulum ATPase